ncbi:hypothetical protein [Candidatus Frankia nodulisporulans]|uniref:hypothetical protein n=1 Tax=Candidatus Frankia nodulisporulans TaxID=2060052 RepID=UPI0013D46D2C|nr:hypothetical protein [Candidatus Frankia nodulisporulans]
MSAAPLFTAGQLEPSHDDMARARAHIAGLDREMVHMVASSAFRFRMPWLLSALTTASPEAAMAAGDLRWLIATGRACDERLAQLDAELDARIATADPKGGAR